MIVYTIFALLALAQVLDSKPEDVDDDIKKVFSAYMNKIPDIEPKYVMNEAISKIISQSYNGKVQVFPLFKISLTIDKQPVKIPWSMGGAVPMRNDKSKSKYTYVKVKQPSEKTNK